MSRLPPELDGRFCRSLSVGLVAWLYQQGGFVTMLHAFAGLCLLVIAAALILPREIRAPAVRGVEAEPA